MKERSGLSPLDGGCLNLRPTLHILHSNNQREKRSWATKNSENAHENFSLNSVLKLTYLHFYCFPSENIFMEINERKRKECCLLCNDHGSHVPINSCIILYHWVSKTAHRLSQVARCVFWPYQMIRSVFEFRITFSGILGLFSVCFTQPKKIWFIFGWILGLFWMNFGSIFCQISKVILAWFYFISMYSVSVSNSILISKSNSCTSLTEQILYLIKEAPTKEIKSFINET